MALLDTLFFDCPGYLDLRALKKGESPRQSFYLPTDLGGIKAWIANNKKLNLYFGVATRDGKAGKKENIVAIPALFVDLDFKRLPGEEAGAIKALESFPFHPTIIVHSGGGYHCYWKFREPEGKESIDKIEAILRGITIRLGADMGSTDASHILRIPNTKNYNYLPHRPVYLKHSNGAEYSLDDFDDFVAEDPGTRKNQTNYSEINSERLDKIMSCRFMQYWKDNAASLPEPDWYCGLTQLIRDPGGVALIHKYSKLYPKYSRKETDAKVIHAINSTGPMTCEKIFKDTKFVCEDPDCRAKAPAGRGLIESEPSPYDDTLESVSGVSVVSGVSKESIGSSGKQSVSNGKQEGAASNSHIEENDKNKDQLAINLGVIDKGAGVSSGKQRESLSIDPNVGGITAQLREWINDSVGSFTVSDVDREFNLRSRAEKNARSRALNKILSENTIIRDRVVKGKYHVMAVDIEFSTRAKLTSPSYPVSFPLEIDTMVSIPPHSIVVVAGTTNAGKTAILFNIAKLNLCGSKKLIYIRSEMSDSEYYERQRVFRDVTEAEWDKMQSCSKSAGFNAVIWKHNRNGITFVDFLEDIGGEFGKMSAGIREVYDALDEGIAIVALQKKTGQEYGRGGELTAEKARLYLSVDKILDCEGCIICSAKMVKVKVPIPANANHSNKELHFKLTGGGLIEPLTPWQFLNEKQRSMLIERYKVAFGEKTTRAVKCHV